MIIIHSTSYRQKKVPFTRNNDFFMATTVLDSQKNFTSQPSRENSSNQFNESYFKENLCANDDIQ